MRRRLLRLIKGLAIVCIGLATVMFAVYSLAWFAFTKRAEAYINLAWHSPDFQMTGDAPHFTGYPMPPEAHFSGVIQHNLGLRIETPLLYYSGFPMPYQLQYFEAPEGLTISAPFIDRILTFQFAALQLGIPRHLPASARKDDIAAWQKRDEPFYIRQIALKSENVFITGSGTLSLDENLQLKADINAHITGMDKLLDEIEEKQGSKSVAMARNFLKMLSKVDPKTGESYFETTLKIQNRGIFFGPMRISGLPELTWLDGTVTSPPPHVPSQ